MNYFGKQFGHIVIALDNDFEAVASMGCLSPSVKSNAAKHRSSNIASSARSCSTVPGDSEETAGSPKASHSLPSAAHSDPTAAALFVSHSLRKSPPGSEILIFCDYRDHDRPPYLLRGQEFDA